MPENNVPASARDYSNLYTPMAIVLAGVVIGAFVMVGLSKMGATAGAGGGVPTAKVDIADVKVDGIPFIGNADAPVTLAYWSDYQCPFCQQYELDTMMDLKTAYVDTGKMKIVFKDYAFLSEDSTTAAVWGRAVWDLFPAQYFAWRVAMYEAQDEEHGGFGNEPTILALTKSVAGINASAVQARVASNMEQYLALIDADRQEGTSFGVQGTPGFITGKILIPGSLPLAEFKAAIDSQL